ncbi:MAG: cation transporter [Verrucomicrobiales bacterium]|jgi:divalent metal cation (Fe/Co/Zn/Cd) transporter|nr:cation transporter [Verrucomicrobiales bacterium]
MEPSHRKIRRVLGVALLVNLALAFGKLYAGWRLDSLAVLADALHSLFGAATCLMSLVALFRIALPDPDTVRRRQKFEFLALLAINGGLLLGCWELFGAAIQDGRQPLMLPVYSPGGMLFLIAALGVNFALSRLQRSWADDFKTHLFTTGLTLLSLYSSRLGWFRCDAIAATLIVILIVLAISALVYEQVSRLTDANNETLPCNKTKS